MVVPLARARDKNRQPVRFGPSEEGAPVIGLNDSGGARIQEGVEALAGYGQIFYRNVQSSGVVPQISVILGNPCAGGAGSIHRPSLDFIFMVEKTAHMFITGPEVGQSLLTTMRRSLSTKLGGAGPSIVNRAGWAHFTAPDEETLLANVRYLLSFLPANNLTRLPTCSRDDPQRPIPELAQIVPDDPQQPYDVRSVIEALADGGEFLEVQSDYAANLVIGFARMDGYPVGIVANQPLHLAGVLDINSSDKGARFIRFCDAFHIPLVTIGGYPWFLPGTDQEYGGVIRHGAKLAYAYSEATVAKVHTGTSQGLRRCVHRDGLQASGWGLQLGLDQRRDCSDGTGRGRQYRILQRYLQPRKTKSAERDRLIKNYPGRICHPTDRRQPRLSG